MTELHQIGTKSPYRLGLPAPLREFPLQSVLADPYCKPAGVLDKHSLSISRLLHRRSCAYHCIEVLQQWEDSHEPTLDDHVLVFRTTIQDEEERVRWADALAELAMLLQDSWPCLLRVEVIDDRAYEHFFPPRIPKNIRDQWPEARKKILHLLAKESRGYFKQVSLTLLNHGYAADHAKLALVIGADHRDHAWQSRFRNIIDPVMSDLELEVVVFTKEYLGMGNVEHGLGVYECKDFTGTLELGASIGLGEATGTLGAFLKVEYKGEMYDMALTCNNVIKHAVISDGEHSSGLPPSLQRASAVVSPSDSDAQLSLISKENEIAMFHDELYGKADKDRNHLNLSMIAKYELHRTDPTVSDRKLMNLKAMIDRYKSCHENHKSSWDVMKGADRRIGSVFASSGLRRCSGKISTSIDAGSGQTLTTGEIIDWALILLDTDRVGNNVLPPFKRLFPYGSDNTIAYYRGHQSMPIDLEVEQKGRTTRGSRGFVSPQKLDIVFNNEDKSSVFSAWVVVGAPSLLEDIGPRAGRKFMAAGDSGACAWTNDLDFACLAIGGNEQFVGYVVPLANIFRDIEEQTGAVILDPVLS